MMLLLSLFSAVCYLVLTFHERIIAMQLTFRLKMAHNAQDGLGKNGQMRASKDDEQLQYSDGSQ